MFPPPPHLAATTVMRKYLTGVFKQAISFVINKWEWYPAYQISKFYSTCDYSLFMLHCVQRINVKNYFLKSERELDYFIAQLNWKCMWTFLIRYDCHLLVCKHFTFFSRTTFPISTKLASLAKHFWINEIQMRSCTLFQGELNIGENEMRCLKKS